MVTTGEVLLVLFTLAVAGMAQPPQVAAGIVLLLSKRGIANGLAYNGAMIAWRVVQGVVLWILIYEVEIVAQLDHINLALIVGTVLAILGIVCVVAAARRLLNRATGGGAADKTASGMAGAVQRATPLQAALLGLFAVAVDAKDWVLTLAALDVIAEAGMSTATSLGLYLVYVLLVQSVTLVPLALCVIAPGRAAVTLGATKGWLERHDQVLTTAMLGVMGLLFVGMGFQQSGLV